MKYLFILAMLLTACAPIENVTVTQQHDKSLDYLMIEQYLYNDSTQVLMWRTQLPATPENTRWVRISPLGTEYSLRRYDLEGKAFTTPFICVLHD